MISDRPIEIAYDRNGIELTLAGVRLLALGSGALWWPDQSILCVSDLHLGKADRYARAGGAALPPYQTQATLLKLQTDLEATHAQTVICLGDSFDDQRAVFELSEDALLWITRLQAGRNWVWIEGNHDPAPLVGIGGTQRATLSSTPLLFQHIADPRCNGEISGHYHPKLRLSTAGRAVSLACFLCDSKRLILPAYGAYTGGLLASHKVLKKLMEAKAVAIVTGKTPRVVPMLC